MIFVLSKTSGYPLGSLYLKGYKKAKKVQTIPRLKLKSKIAFNHPGT